MTAPGQLELLGDSGPTPWLGELRRRIAAWTARGVFFGTSSWKYEGWLGQVYSAGRYTARGRFSKHRFEAGCLAEYGETFPTVCGDFAFYQFYQDAFWQRLFDQVPATFRFGFKIPERITCPHFPAHARYGARAGQDNPDFLDAGLLRREFLDRLRPYAAQIGYLVFEFPQVHPAPDKTHQAAFLDRLDAFLGELPATFPYGVELRTASWLDEDYLACLRRHRVGHVFNSWTRMPTIGEQLDCGDPFTGETIVARLLLKPGRAYEQAVAEFQPYREVRDPYPPGYRDAARLVLAAKQRQLSTRVYLAVNNRFTGNAPRAIEAILDELDRSG